MLTKQPNGSTTGNSVSSKLSLSSATSRTSTEVIKTCASAAAAQAGATYSRREIKIKVEKAHLEATLETSQQEKEAEAAQVEPTVMEAAAAEFKMA